MVQRIRRRIGFEHVLRTLVAALIGFGIWLTLRARWVLAHGGDTSFGATFKYPTWASAHFLSALVFILILPFQLWSGIRRRYPLAHRLSGVAAASAGTLFSVTGLLLPYVMPARPFGERAFMTTVSCAFVFMLGRGIASARRRDLITHRRWMLRVTAFAMGPLTQRTLFPFFAAAGIDSLSRFWDLFMTAAWLSLALNVAIVEWWIRRTASDRKAQAVDPRGITVAARTA
jgi:Predicted membrane protein (DUF2306)